MKSICYLLLLQCLLFVQQYHASDKPVGPTIRPRKPIILKKSLPIKPGIPANTNQKISSRSIPPTINSPDPKRRSKTNAVNTLDQSKNAKKSKIRQSVSKSRTRRTYHKAADAQILKQRITTWYIGELDYTDPPAGSHKIKKSDLELTLKTAISVWSTVSDLNTAVYKKDSGRKLTENEWLIQPVATEEWIDIEKYNFTNRTTTLYLTTGPYTHLDAKIPTGEFYGTTITSVGFVFRLNFTNSKSCAMTSGGDLAFNQEKPPSSLCEDDIAGIREVQGFRSETTEITAAQPCKPWNGTRYMMVNRASSLYFVSVDGEVVASSYDDEQNNKRIQEFYFVRPSTDHYTYAIVSANNQNRWIKSVRDQSKNSSYLTEEGAPEKKSDTNFLYTFRPPRTYPELMKGLCYIASAHGYLTSPTDNSNSGGRKGGKITSEMDSAEESAISIAQEWQLRPVRGSPCHPRLGQPHKITRSVLRNSGMTEYLLFWSSRREGGYTIGVSSHPFLMDDVYWRFEAVGALYLIVHHDLATATGKGHSVKFTNFTDDPEQYWHVERVENDQCVILSGKKRLGWQWNDHLPSDDNNEWEIVTEDGNMNEKLQYFTIKEEDFSKKKHHF